MRAEWLCTRGARVVWGWAHREIFTHAGGIGCPLWALGPRSLRGRFFARAADELTSLCALPAPRAGCRRLLDVSMEGEAASETLATAGVSDTRGPVFHSWVHVLTGVSEVFPLVNGERDSSISLSCLCG